MKFRILEGKQELLAKYGKRLPPEEFNSIYNQIPEKLKGYGDWVFKNAIEGRDVGKIIEALQAFVKYRDRLENKDINFYSTVAEVENAIKGAVEKGSKKEKTYAAKLVYEDDKVKVVRPLTHEASRHYGTGTNWCTATSSPEHFNNYKKKGKLFYILPKDGKEKYAIFSHWTGQKEGFNTKDNFTKPETIMQKFGLPEKLFVAEFDLSTEEGKKDFLSSVVEEGNCKILGDGSIKVEGDVNLSRMKLEKIPFNFKTVGGNFDCSNNPKLTSLQGAPEKVGWNFDCSNNPKLTSLQGAPEKVGGNFDCSNNPKLTSLQGAPEKVGWNFDCSNNPKLTSLQGAPEKVGWNFDCFNNPKLTSLQGAPEKVGGNFDCFNNPKLTSLQGAPEKVGGNFYCFNNPKLTSLQGAPKEVSENFYCSNNPKLPKSEIERVKKIYKLVIESVRKIKFKVI